MKTSKKWRARVRDLVGDDVQGTLGTREAMRAAHLPIWSKDVINTLLDDMESAIKIISSRDNTIHQLRINADDWYEDAAMLEEKLDEAIELAQDMIDCISPGTRKKLKLDKRLAKLLFDFEKEKVDD